MNLIELTNILRDLADRVNLVVFASHPRAPKKTRRVLKRTLILLIRDMNENERRDAALPLLYKGSR